MWPSRFYANIAPFCSYAYHIIPGAAGLQRGLWIQQAAAFSVLVMATIGVFFTSIVARPIALQLAAIDSDCALDGEESPLGKQLVSKSSAVDMRSASIGAVHSNDGDNGGSYG